jgi:hypothetical protein
LSHSIGLTCSSEEEIDSIVGWVTLAENPGECPRLTVASMAFSLLINLSSASTESPTLYSIGMHAVLQERNRDQKDKACRARMFDLVEQRFPPTVLSCLSLITKRIVSEVPRAEGR